MLATHTAANQASRVPRHPGHQQPQVDEQDAGEGDVVAEAVLAGEEIEELAFEPGATVAGAFDAETAGTGEGFFVRDGPGDAGHRPGQNEQPHELGGNAHPRVRMQRDCRV